MDTNLYDLVIIGGGAAGFFAGITYAHTNPSASILLLEKTQQVLTKVKVSGGGRCNVTHACFNPALLVKNYPRGGKELLGPFTRFQPRDVIDWYQSNGVELKVESDGRMFPVTDSSQTIIDCLLKAASGITVQRGKSVAKIEKDNEEFIVVVKPEDQIRAKCVMLATGSSPAGHALAKELGHSIVDPVPSLFTFNVPDSPLIPLAGISVPHASVSLPEYKSEQSGPLLLTHWGFSGPAVLKLSAFCARELHDCDYNSICQIDWIPEITQTHLKGKLLEKKEQKHQKSVVNDPIGDLPKNLWKSLVSLSGIDESQSWPQLSKTKIDALVQKLKQDRYKISGKTTYKQEFVTCGGVKLSEVNFQTMESKLVPGLFFGGEVLDIDGITGGFNFQAAWTTGWLAGKAIAAKSR